MLINLKVHRLYGGAFFITTLLRTKNFVQKQKTKTK